MQADKIYNDPRTIIAEKERLKPLLVKSSCYFTKLSEAEPLKQLTMSKFKKKKGDLPAISTASLPISFLCYCSFYGSFCKEQHFNGFKHPACSRSGSKAG